MKNVLDFVQFNFLFFSFGNSILNEIELFHSKTNYRREKKLFQLVEKSDKKMFVDHLFFISKIGA